MPRKASISCDHISSPVRGSIPLSDFLVCTRRIFLFSSVVMTGELKALPNIPPPLTATLQRVSPVVLLSLMNPPPACTKIASPCTSGEDAKPNAGIGESKRFLKSTCHFVSPVSQLSA